MALARGGAGAGGCGGGRWYRRRPASRLHAGGQPRAAGRASSPSSVSSSAGLAGASSSSSEELKPAVGGPTSGAVPAPTRHRWTSRPRWAGRAGSASRPARASSQASRGLAGAAAARAGGVAGGAAPTRWRLGERSNVTVRRPGRKASMSSPSVSTRSLERCLWSTVWSTCCPCERMRAVSRW